MSAARSTSYSNDGGIDTAPLLGSQIFPSRRFMRRPPSLRGAARFLRRMSSRRMMREPSMRVREAAAEQIEERQTDWAYSKPVVALDLLWNLMFVIVSVSVLITSRKEKPTLPLRVWIVGYCFQCLLHMVCVCLEYKRRWQQRNSMSRGSSGSFGSGGGRWSSGNSSSGSDEGETVYFTADPMSNDEDMRLRGVLVGSMHQCIVMENRTSRCFVAKHLESGNTLFSFIWWIIGFYWVSADPELLSQDSPQLYWLCIAFLAFDVLFVVICIAVACIIGIAVCCCLPCIIAILYAVADQEGATREDIERLPRYKFHRILDSEKQNGEIQESFNGVMTKCDTDTPVEHVLPLEDAECCICLCTYEDGAELRELPCRHHFHCACIDKWLSINAICPLCKYNILKNGSQSCSEEV